MRFGTPGCRPADIRQAIRQSRSDEGLLRRPVNRLDHAALHVDEFIAQGDSVVARGSTAWVNKKTGKKAETPKVDFWRFRDGMAVEFYEYFDTACVAAAAA